MTDDDLLSQAVEVCTALGLVPVVEGSEVRVEGTDEGFDVAWLGGVSDQMVSCGLWHVHFFDADESLRAFNFMLSSQVRLKEVMAGDSPVSSTAEFFEDGEWKAMNTVRLVIVNPFKQKKTFYRQNTH